MSGKPLLVQFGAGNIGRSLVGQLFASAGWKVVFLDVADSLIKALNERCGYRVTVKDQLLPGQAGYIDVQGVSGVHLVRDRGHAVELLARADLAGTSVGAANLASACSLLADAAAKRAYPLSVILCENLHDASVLARKHFDQALDGRAAAKLGFIEAAISKMVPSTPPEVAAEDPLAVWAEAYNTLYLDADAYIGTPPAVPGVAWRGSFPAYVDRKLMIHNFGHAAAAYHGALAGKKYIWECMEDERISEETRGCMMETSRALAIRYPETFTFDENRAWADDLLRRFRNRALGDPVARVGRDLLRKLAPGDRCVGALRLLEKTGVANDFSAKVIAAAMLFSPDTDLVTPLESDRELLEMASSEGPESILTGVCGFDPDIDEKLIRRITDEYRRLR